MVRDGSGSGLFLRASCAPTASGAPCGDASGCDALPCQDAPHADMASCDAPSRSSACAAGSPHSRADRLKSLPARFEMLYESRDGKLCLFETKEGHLSAVDSSKFS